MALSSRSASLELFLLGNRQGVSKALIESVSSASFSLWQLHQGEPVFAAHYTCIYERLSLGELQTGSAKAVVYHIDGRSS